MVECSCSACECKDTWLCLHQESKLARARKGLPELTEEEYKKMSEANQDFCRCCVMVVDEHRGVITMIEHRSSLMTTEDQITFYTYDWILNRNPSQAHVVNNPITMTVFGDLRY